MVITEFALMLRVNDLLSIYAQPLLLGIIDC